ncbi:hypothetical protein K1719_022457 [Acacia pycnantha]|nr:hypothetical protein K1719_022457 [Acacia pycnantha]
MQVEQISFAVERAAEMVEEMAEAAANRLPQGKLHDSAEFVEKLAEEIDKVAHLSVDLLEKVEEMEKKVDSFLDSAIQGKKADVR